MEIVGMVDGQDEPVSFAALRCHRDGAVREMGNPVQEESALSLYINGTLSMVIGCSASHLVELVVGRLFTEGIVQSAADIDRIVVHDGARRIDVTLNDSAQLLGQGVEEVPTFGGASRAAAERLRTASGALHAVTPIPWNPSWVFSVADEFFQDKTAHARTRGVHSAYLAVPGKTLCLREDIGRHNAFDKVIGWALMNDVDLRQCLIFTSGRVPTDMVTKAVRARIPLLVSKAVATDKTVEIARQYQLTLICQAKPESMDVLNDPMGALAPRCPSEVGRVA